MSTPIDKISLKLKGAEFFNTSVEKIQATLLYSNLFFDLIKISFEDEAIWVKLAHQTKMIDPHFQLFSLETEVLAREIITQKTKLKLNEIIEFNQTHDLLPSDYIIFSVPDGELLDAKDFNTDFKIQIDDFQSHFYKINSATFGDLLENNAHLSWSASFQNKWQQLINIMQVNLLIDKAELKCADDFFQAIKPSLNEECLPVLINLNLTPYLFIKSYHQITGYSDFSSCYFGTPEFEMAKRDYLKFSETPAMTEYKRQLQTDIEVKARYFIYYVCFLFEDFLFQFSKTGSIITANKFKNMANTLMKNALS